MDSLTYIQLLRRNRSFRRLWWGQVISELGNWFNFIAGLGLVRLISHGDAAVTTIMLLARMVPFTVFAPLAGAFVDRWSRRMVMIASDFARVAVAIGFLLVRGPEDLWIAYLCTALLSFFGCFFEAAKSAAMPNITGERDLLAGNALMFSSRFSSCLWAGAWWLDCRQCRISSGIHCKRRVLLRLRPFGLADSRA